MQIHSASIFLRGRAMWLLLGLLSWPFASALALEADSDIPGSADYQLLKRYPHSHIIRYESSATVEPYTLILGSIKKANSVVSPEAEREIEGLTTRITYRIPDGRRSAEVFDHFRAELAEHDAELLFSCSGRDCGSSNYWANRIFRIATLYGPEQYQNFLVAKVLLEGKEQYISIYTLQRGNRRLYAHIEIVSAASDATVVEGEAILATLTASGRYPLVGVEFDAGGALIPAADSVLREVALALEEDRELEIYVVGHLDAKGALADLVDESRRRAQLIVDRLVGEGIEASRLTAAGVGPLAPSAGFSGERIELVTR